jgi:hypothetical protein
MDQSDQAFITHARCNFLYHRFTCLQNAPRVLSNVSPVDQRCKWRASSIENRNTLTRFHRAETFTTSGRGLVEDNEHELGYSGETVIVSDSEDNPTERSLDHGKTDITQTAQAVEDRPLSTTSQARVWPSSPSYRPSVPTRLQFHMLHCTFNERAASIFIRHPFQVPIQVNATQARAATQFHAYGEA